MKVPDSLLHLIFHIKVLFSALSHPLQNITDMARSVCYQFKKDSQVRLEPHQCKALLAITGWKAWQVTKDPLGARQAILEAVCQEEEPPRGSSAWALPAAPFHMLNFGPYTDREVANMHWAASAYYPATKFVCTERDCCGTIRN